MQVKDAMTRKPITVGPDESIADAAAKLSITKLHVLPVVDGENILQGLLLERDLLLAIVQNYPEPSEVPLHQLARFVLPEMRVRDLMKPPTATLRAGVPIKHAAQKMLEYSVYGLPIVDEAQHVLGVFTVTDLLKAVIKSELMVLWP